MQLDWYLERRIIDQHTFYDGRRIKHESDLSWLRWIGVTAGFATVVLGVFGGKSIWLTPWICAITTISAAITAVGLLDRHKYLVASYAAMTASLRHIEELRKSGGGCHWRKPSFRRKTCLKASTKRGLIK